MTSSPSPFANTGKLQVLPTPATLLFTQPINNNNMANATQTVRQTNTLNGPILQHHMNGGITTTPTSIMRLHQPQTTPQTHHIAHNPGQFQGQTTWTNSVSPSSQTQFTIQKPSQVTPIVQYTAVKNEPSVPIVQQQQQQQPQQTSILPPKVVAQPVIRQTVGAPPQATTYTESQINDFVSKCRTFLTTLLRLAEKQAPEKLPMVRACIQELLDGTIDPELFTKRLHMLYKSQPHTSLVPFFKLALPHMRNIVQKTFGRPINIELLEKLQLPPSSNNNSINSITNPSNQTTAHIQMTNTNIALNPSLLSQHHQQQQPQQQQQQQQQQQHQQQLHGNTVIQQPLFTTVQTQQKINIVSQANTPTVIGQTGSLLSQQHQHQLQARAQNTMRPILSNSPSATHPSLLSAQQVQQQQQQNQQQSFQSVTPMIIQQADNITQRSLLQPSTSTTTLQQPQIITVNHQPIKTETIHTQPSLLNPLASTQPKMPIKSEEDLNDDPNHSALVDTRQLVHDDRLIPAMILRRRQRDLVEKEKRMPVTIPMDDAALALISHATQERLKYLIEQIKLIAHHRIDLSMKNDPNYQQTSDVKSQIRFLEDLDKIEKQKKDKIEQEKIFRAAKSRSKTNDPEAAKLKQRAKEMQQAQVEEKRQQEANETALAAIGKPKKRKLEESTNHIHSSTVMSSNGSESMLSSSIQPSPSSNALNSTTMNSKTKAAKRICRANLRDLLSIMERDKYLRRTPILVKALNK